MTKLAFNIPSAAYVVWRRGHSLKYKRRQRSGIESHQKDRTEEEPGIKLGACRYWSSGLPTTLPQLLSTDKSCGKQGKGLHGRKF